MILKSDFWLTGECINSSPAGKRRIAAEKQFAHLADDTSNEFSLLDEISDVGGAGAQVKTPVMYVALGVVAVCSVFAVAVMTMFTVAHVSWKNYRSLRKLLKAFQSKLDLSCLMLIELFFS